MRRPSYLRDILDSFVFAVSVTLASFVLVITLAFGVFVLTVPADGGLKGPPPSVPSSQLVAPRCFPLGTPGVEGFPMCADNLPPMRSA